MPVNCAHDYQYTKHYYNQRPPRYDWHVRIQRLQKNAETPKNYGYADDQANDHSSSGNSETLIFHAPVMFAVSSSVSLTY
jgi:hypothetical protein